MGRSAGFTFLVLVLVALGTGVAAADAPGPTDYQSEITDIDPPADGIELEIIGGDSFVLLTADPGVSVDVVGYFGEPYLRFLADGTVEENRLAPSKYLNEDRYAAAEMPAEANPDAVPAWVVVASDGSFAWHDHRTHWMNEKSPPGRGPGDAVAEGVVPLLVDGVEVDVAVVSIWQEPPSPAPVAAGLTAGLLIGLVAVRRHRILKALLLILASAASVVGVAAYLSVPAETVPPWSLWVFPVTSGLLALVALLVQSRWVADQERIILLIAALELVAWGAIHWAWLWPAVLPTTIPFWIDRLVASIVLVGALGAAAAVIASAAPRRSGLLSGSP